MGDGNVTGVWGLFEHRRRGRERDAAGADRVREEKEVERGGGACAEGAQAMG